MKITDGGTKQELRYLRDLFRKLFENRVDDVLETTIYGKLELYMYYHADKDFLENFVKEYFVMRRQIVDARNHSIDYIISREYRESSLLNRRRAEKQLKKYRILCERINRFEKEFYKRTNISLLRVENERRAREKKESKEQTIQQ